MAKPEGTDHGEVERVQDLLIHGPGNISEYLEEGLSNNFH